jgi:hypothetical protein
VVSVGRLGILIGGFRPSEAERNAKGRRLSRRTQEAIAKVQGKPLGREMLEWASIRLTSWRQLLVDRSGLLPGGHRLR